MIRIGWLPERTLALIERTATALEASLGARLEAVFLVGAALNPQRFDRAQAPELVAIMGGRDPLDLPAVARALTAVVSQGARVRILTSEELLRSCDVFALEIAEWKARHHLLKGQDVLAPLTITRSHLRHGIEVELRGISRRVRNRILLGLAALDRHEAPEAALMAGYDGFVIAAHHALELLGKKGSGDEASIVRAIAAEADVDPRAFVDQLTELRRGARSIDFARAFAVLVSLLDPVCDVIDRLEIAE